MKKILSLHNLLLFAALTVAATLHAEIYNLKDFGIIPNRPNVNSSVAFQNAFEKIGKLHRDSKEKAKVIIPAGSYYFAPAEGLQRSFFISNHDQTNPKNPGIIIQGVNDLDIDFQGSELIFDGRMLPMALINSTDCTLKNFSIDFTNPQISQVTVIENNPEGRSIVYQLSPEVDYEIQDSVLYVKGNGWRHSPCAGIAFESGTGHIIYNTSDINVGSRKVVELAPRLLKSYSWKNEKLIPGTVVAMRTYDRPAPAIFLEGCRDITFENVTVHYAEGMGLLAQLCDTITLNGFNVAIKEGSGRYFTTQADATHFSGCKGLIKSVNGLYEGMMDDAINVHGTYLKVVKVLNDSTLVGRYMHPQTYGFPWGFPADSVAFVKSNTMDVLEPVLHIASILPEGDDGKEFRITFDRYIPQEMTAEEDFGIENLSWTPEVIFSNNIVRNNRARGALFSTPRKVIVENNLFDHTSGSAILLCGDCNGWFETGSCRDVTIAGNYFLNSLTNMFQFTNAVISIYPEIPNLDGQKKHFHSGITIENNIFDSFDIPMLYAKSVNGLIFRDNIFRTNQDYKPFHWNKNRVLLEHVINANISE